jgi:hypothetical protein
MYFSDRIHLFLAGAGGPGLRTFQPALLPGMTLLSGLQYSYGLRIEAFDDQPHTK